MDAAPLTIQLTKFIRKYLYFIVTICALSNTASALSADRVDSTTNLIVLSDPAHYKLQPRQQVARLLVDLKAAHSGFDCLLLEWGQDSNPAIQDYVNHRKNYQDSIEADIERVTKILGRRPYELVPEFLLSTAADGYKVFAVDKNWSDLDPVWRDDDYAASLHATVETRNEAAAQESHNHFLNGDCHKAVIVVGSGHTVEVDNGFAVKPIQSYLKDLGYQTQLFLLTGF